MKIILISYPGSQRIRKASKYLTKKYLKGFKVTYISHGGSLDEWSAFIATFLKKLKSRYVIMALDDYLLNSPLKKDIVDDIIDLMRIAEVSVTKLCECTNEENVEYPVTTQYCIWDRKYLISLLERTTTPWDFEVKGSQIFKLEEREFMHYPVMHYDVHSCLSARWQGINYSGVKEEDLPIIKQLCI